MAENPTSSNREGSEANACVKSAVQTVAFAGSSAAEGACASAGKADGNANANACAAKTSDVESAGRSALADAPAEAAASGTGVAATAASDALGVEIDRYLAESWDQVVSDIDTLVRIPSVEDLSHAAPGAPFGPTPKRALSAALDIARRMGLDAHDCEGYIGYADLPGASDTQIGIIGHTDVVAAGPGWTFEPYEVQRRDGYLLGRGTSDDKGPLMVAVHAVYFWKRLLEEKPQLVCDILGIDPSREPRLPYTVRVLFGSNEETSMGDVAYYRAHFADSAFLFTPDAEFPVCYGESGICSGWLESAPIEGGNLIALEGGAAVNAVPGHARAVVRASLSQLAPAERVSLTDNGDGTVTIEVTGKAAHASTPEQGLSAIALLVNYLLATDVCTFAEREYLQLDWALLRTTDGSAVDLQARDDEFGPLSCVGGIIALEPASAGAGAGDGAADGLGDSAAAAVGEAHAAASAGAGAARGTGAVRIRQSFDFRYPTTTSAQQISDKINELAQVIDARFDLEHDKKPFLMSPTSPAVQALLSAYNEVTGENAQPFTMKGGTYARMFSNGASFGPDKPWERKPAWVGSMHGPDEGIREGLLKDAFAIYVRTIGQLMRLKL